MSKQILAWNNIPLSYNNSPITYGIQSIGLLNFGGNDSNYVLLDGNPNLSGNKVVTWKMWIDPSVSPINHAFFLGADGDNVKSYFDYSGNFVSGNFNEGDIGSVSSINFDSYKQYLVGKNLSCVAAKTSTESTWLSIGGFIATMKNQSFSEIGRAHV